MDLIINIVEVGCLNELNLNLFRKLLKYWKLKLIVTNLLPENGSENQGSKL